LLFLRKNTSNSRLMTRGFHWINEKPYNFWFDWKLKTIYLFDWRA
jgi:hypothetical protein